MPDNPNISGYVVVDDWSPAGVYKGGQGASVVNYSLGTWQAIRPRRGIPPGTISGEWLRVPTKVQQSAPYIPPPPPLPGPPPAPKITITGTPPVQVNAIVQSGAYNANVVVGVYYPTIQTSGGQIVKGLRGLVPDPPSTPGTSLFLCEDGTWAPAGGGGGGTVTSVALAAPVEFNVTGSPVIAAGTLTLAWATESSNFIFAGPVSGPSATPAFRALVPADIGTGTPAAGKYVDGGTGAWTTLPPPGTGTVTSVDMTVPTILSVSGNPITTSGTLAVTLANESQNLVFIGPVSGPPTTPTFRAIDPADLSGGTPGAGKYWDGGGTGSWTTLPPPGTGTVTSVDLALPVSLYTISGNPVTTSGTLTGTLINQTANFVWAGPTGGPAATPTFRALVAADIPALSYVTSVGLTLPAEFTVTVSPITSSGSLTAIWANETANRFFAGPSSGSPATPTFRVVSPADLPGGTPGAGKYWDGAGTGAWTTLPAPGTGTVTSVALSMPSIFSVSGSPVTTSGTLTAALQTQSANTLFAGPTSGGAATPTFRTVIAEDIASGTATTGYAAVSTGVGAAPAWTLLQGTAVGFLSGVDSARPAPSAANVYCTTDTNQQYFSDNTKWYVGGKGSDKVTIGALAGQFSDANYLVSTSGSATIGPTMVSPYTICIGFRIASLPGTGGGVLCGVGLGNISNGWFLASSLVNSNKFRLYMQGFGTPTMELSGLTALTTGPHVVALNINGTAVRYCMDGGSVSTASYTGTYTPPTTASGAIVGRFFGSTGFSAPWADFSYWVGFGAALSDGDLQALSGSPSSYIPGVVSTAPAYNWQARWIPDSGYISNIGFQAYGTTKTPYTALAPVSTGGIWKTDR